MQGRSPARLRLQIISLAATLWVAASAQAQSIAPVVIELSRARPVVSVTITNSSDRALRLQTNVLAWSQPDGTDHYEETDELMVVPPVVDIQPRVSQIFRVALRQRAFPPNERAYRVVLEDVTPGDSTATTDDSVAFHLAHRLPVFVTGTVVGKPQARLGACPPPMTETCLRIDNDGGRYLQVFKLTVAGDGWSQEVAGVGTRVLAHAWHQWMVNLPQSPKGALHVEAATSAGPLTAEIAVP
jgi:fimbrial chaperone protein